MTTGGRAGDRRLAVALMNFTFWPETRRGSERLIHELATDLTELGHRPRILTSHAGLPHTRSEFGVTITRTWRPPTFMLARRRIERQLTHLPFSYASLRRHGEDLAHAFYPTDALAATRWARDTGRPAIFSYMGIPQRNVLSTPRLRLRILEQATRSSSAVTVLSRAARDAMWRWLGVEARLVYPGVRLNAFTPGGERDPDPVIACMAATDDDRKRIDLLVEAFALVRRERPTARLVLMRPRDERRAGALRGRSAGIEFLDRRTTAVADVFRRAWVSALTSYNEAFGLVLVEALACGTPVVGARDGGIPEIIDRPEIGRLFDGAEPGAVAKALLEGLELAQDRSTAAACRRRAEDFTTLAGARAYAELYAELLAG